MTASSPHRDTTAGRPAYTDARLTGLLVLMCLALTLVLAANASLTVALPEIARTTGATQTQLTWVINGYALLFAALLLPAGLAADRFGRRPALALGLGVFGVASLVSAYVDSPGWLIALRVVAGIGATLVMPATLSVLTDAYPPERRAAAVAVWAGVSGAGVLLGMLAGGVLLEWFWWGSVQLVFGLAAVVLALVCLAAVPSYRNPRLHLDPLGALCAVVALGALTYGIIEAPELGWTDSRTVTGLVVGVLGIAAFVLVELRGRDPLLDVRLFRYRGLSVGSAMIVLQFVAVLGLLIFLPQYLQSVRGNTPLGAAVMIMPLAVGIMPASQLAPALVARLGDRVVVSIGMAVTGIGYAYLATLSQDGPYWLIAVGLIASGAGFGLATAPATALILNGLPDDRRTLASAVNDTAREVGGAIGIAVFATVLSTVYRNAAEDFTRGVPGEAATVATDGVNGAVAVADRLGPAGPALADAARAGFYDGYQAALVVGAGVLLLGAALCAAFAPRRTAGSAVPVGTHPAAVAGGTRA